MMKPVVGQKLWFVGARLGNFKALNGEVTVTAVGKKWADVQGEFHGRVDVTTLVADGKGYASPGRCYLSRLEWLDKEGSKLAWEALRVSMLGSCPAELSYETIVQAGKLLGLDISLPGEEVR
ncbi:hypothetical protein WJ96_04655 [Burkholderia ubonensis]|uniref:Uncharacterized protein n=1 Tax=Burkholderia ubonensis TaxID=101571 RepID=A0AAW3MV88_9BURK|nr:hypothetical protein [Burkholderia ubonensis]KVP65662.1 hypothetical protein WJ93_24390 [Burkholderia ubonensis]KVP97863.1 hypothetical protein WJ96_04655 [Burkholderia ubonensis]KVZ92560.1 hypothetical protein WL25_16310 [Burkholderia ubonensis]